MVVQTILPQKLTKNTLTKKENFIRDYICYLFKILILTNFINFVQ